MIQKPLLSILIPSIPSRAAMLGELLALLQHQIIDAPVEVMTLIDNKAMTIGEKRDALVQLARGKFCAFLDDDDLPLAGYVKELVSAAKTHPDVDVVVFNQQAWINGKPFVVRFGLEYENEQAQLRSDGTFGDIKRKPFHVCAWRSSLAKKYHFLPLQDGEDWAWVQQLLTEAKSQHRIDKVLHAYRYDDRISEAK